MNPEKTIADFPIGARVEYRNTDLNGHYNGRQGEIVGQGSYGPKIKWDDGGATLQFPYPENVHLLPEPEPTLADTLRARADALQAEIEAEDRAIIAERRALDDRRVALGPKQMLAAEYRAVADDLEAQK